MPRISADQIRQLEDIADELARIGQIEDQVGMPPAFYLKQLDKALPDIATRIRDLAATVAQQSDMEARF